LFQVFYLFSFVYCNCCIWVFKSRRGIHSWNRNSCWICQSLGRREISYVYGLRVRVPNSKPTSGTNRLDPLGPCRSLRHSSAHPSPGHSRPAARLLLSSSARPSPQPLPAAKHRPPHASTSVVSVRAHRLRRFVAVEVAPPWRRS
jgi:hypothetical protein